MLCSKGTYIRSLARDIGAALGCGAHLAALRRTATGGFTLEQAHALAELETLAAARAGEAAAAAADDDQATWARLDALLLPVDALMATAPVVELRDPQEAERFCSGLARRVAAADAPTVRVYGRLASDTAPRFVGSGSVQQGRLRPQRLLSAEELQQTATIIAPSAHACARPASSEPLPALTPP